MLPVLSIDPSDMVYRIVKGAVPAVSVGYDMPTHDELQRYWTTALADGTSVLADFYTSGLGDGTSVLQTLADDHAFVFLTLGAAAMHTPISQRWTLTASVYATQDSGYFDHSMARILVRQIVAALMRRQHDHPLVNVELQSGPIRMHDGQLDTDYLYATFALTVACE